VTVANGAKIKTNTQVANFTWWSQGHTFTHSARVLDILYYDLVLGMDWLEKHSPMWVHWKCKLLRFTHQGQRIALKGTKDSVSKCPKLKLRKLKGMVRKGGIAQMVHLCPFCKTHHLNLLPKKYKTSLMPRPIYSRNLIHYHHQENLIITFLLFLE
jgi:hypothetical protein